MYPDVVRIIFLLSGRLGALSLLYFINLVSGAGHLLVIILKMMYDTTIFLLVGFVVFITFANVFYALSVDPELCPSNSNNSASGSID